MLVHGLALSLLLVQVHHVLHLHLTFLLRQDELMDQPLFADHDALLVNDVVELSVILLQYLVFVVLLVLIVLEVLVTSIQASLVVFLLLFITTFAFLLAMLVVQLFQNVLDLSLELVINLVHQVLQHFRHPELLGLLPQILPGENRIQCTIHVRSHLQVIVLYQLVEYFE